MLYTVNVVLTQLHPKGWSVIRGFKILCDYLGFPPTIRKFFYFFTPKIHFGGAQWVSLYRKRNNLQKPLKDSYKNWKDRFFRISYDLGVPGENVLSHAGGQRRFPLYWTHNPQAIALQGFGNLASLEQLEVVDMAKLKLKVSELFSKEKDPAGL